jgi:hypothetical protein
MADPTLLDVAASVVPDFVEIRGTKLPVYGLDLEAIAKSIQELPDIIAAIKDGKSQEIDLKALVVNKGALVKFLIAAGTGNIGQAKFEEAASRLHWSDQVKILKKVFALTFPDGIGPFVNTFADAAAQVGQAVSKEAAEPKTSAIN